LKVRHRNPKCCENNFPKKNKADRHAKGGEDSQNRLSFSIFARSTRAEADENRHEPNRIDRYKNRNKGKKELFNHGIMPAFSLYRTSLLHNVRSLHQSNLSV
jgi:hypothetical protein